MARQGNFHEDSAANIFSSPTMARTSLLCLLALPAVAAFQLAGARPAMRVVPSTAARAAPLGPVMNSEEEGIRAGLVTEVPFEVRFSLGNLISASGAVLLLYSVLAFILNNGESSLVQTLGFVYGIPASLGGLALKYAELPPVPVTTSPAAEAAREVKANKAQKKILSDATRFCYGDAHMEEPLKALKLAPPGRGPPELKSFTESVTEDGEYALGMTFFAPYTPYTVWKQRGKKFGPFFGDGQGKMRIELKKVSSQKRLVELTLITVSDGGNCEPLEVLSDGTKVPLTVEIPPLNAPQEAEAEAVA
jgi:hypothetical protein